MTPNDQHRIVIVDGYSTGGELLHELLERNVECLHLRSESHPRPAIAMGFDPGPYDGDLGYVGDIGAAVQLLRELAPDAVVPGSECGVGFAEAVAAGLGAPTNALAIRDGRQYAFGMLQAARRRGLQRLAPTAETCFDRPQFIVNTVSQGGRHFVTDAWGMILARRGAALTLEGFELLDPSNAISDALIDYALRVLAELGIVNGAAHTQLQWTAQGPALVGAAACLTGMTVDGPSYRAAGIETQASVYARVLAGSNAERDALFKAHRYRLAHHMTKLLFNFREPAEVRSLAGLDRLKTLRSFHVHHRALEIGDHVLQTAAWLARGGVVYLIHDDAGQIGADIKQFRLWEDHGELYGLAPLSAEGGRR
jgi:hypothetical protein